MIKEKDVILVTFTAYDQSGNVFDTTSRELAKHVGIYTDKQVYGPVAMIVGECQIVKGIDLDVIDKEVGYQASIEIPPKFGFGEYEKEYVEVLPLDYFEDRPAKGQIITMDGRRGEILTVIGKRVKVDFNHPRVDQTLKYDYQIVYIAQNKAEKLNLMCKSVTLFDIYTEIKDDNIAVIDAPLHVIKNMKQWHGLKQVFMKYVFEIVGVDFVFFVEKYKQSEK